MTVLALVSGSLFRSVESRTSKNGRQFVSATLRCQDGGESLFVRLVAFSTTAQDELMRLADGDVVSVQGPIKVETYTASDGSTKVSLNLVADHVLALRPPPRERKAKAAQDTRTRSWQSPADGPNDDLPF